MLRHAYGFGVHSPFAYHFVTEVIHQPYAYYSYASLTTSLERLIFRVVLDLQPHRVAIFGPRQWAEAVREVSRTIVISPRRPDLVLAKCSVLTAASKADILDRVGEGASVFATDCNAELADEIENRLTRGMTFSNGRGVLIVVNRDLPRQDFELSF